MKGPVLLMVLALVVTSGAVLSALLLVTEPPGCFAIAHVLVLAGRCK